MCIRDRTYCFPLLGAPVPKEKTVAIFGRNPAGHEILYAMLGKKALYVYPGYRWDGASGPTIDSEDSMQASLFHDVVYQMLRERKLPLGKLRTGAPTSGKQ